MPRLARSARQPQLGGHDPGEVGGLDEVLEDVLPVAGAVAQPAEQRDHLGVHLGDADLDQRVLPSAYARAPRRPDLGPLVLLLDALRMDAAVEHERLEGHPADLATDRVEAGQQHRLGGVVDDDVDAGDGLVGADVAPLAADDPALHVIARQVQDRDDRLGGLLARDPLDRERDDATGPILTLVARLGLDVAHDQRGVTLGLGLDVLDQLGTRLGRRQPGNLLEHPAPLLLEVGELRLATRDVGFGTRQLVLAGHHLVGFLLQPLRALLEPRPRG